MRMKYRYVPFTLILTLFLITGCSASRKTADEEAFTPDLSSAPTLLLASQQPEEATLEIRSGSFSWNYQNDDETMIGMIACSSHPLDDETLSHTAILELPQKEETNAVTCSFSNRISPDELLIRIWNRSDLGDTDAQEISVTALEDPGMLLELETGYVYEITATWTEDSLTGNGFYGCASYVLVTE